MTNINIAASVAAYQPTTKLSAPSAPPQDVQASDPTPDQTSDQDTNASNNAPAVYTALANASAPTIRGTTVNTAA